MPTPGVDFFRVDRSGPTRRLLVTGVVLVTLGASSVGAHLIHRLPESASHTISLVGGVTMLAGLVLAFGALAMMLFENVYIAIEDQRLVLHDNGKEVVIAWDDLAAVSVEGRTGFLSLERKEAKAVRWYAGGPAKDIAAKIQEARRKALHGLLKTGASNPPSSS